MNISADTFLAIIESLRSDRDNENKRAHPRVGLSGRATVRTGDGRFAGVFVRDLSRAGIGLVQSTDAAPGSRFTLCFAADPDAQQCQGMLCEVARAARIGEGLFAVGARFIEKLTVPLKSEPSLDPEIKAMMRQLEHSRTP